MPRYPAHTQYGHKKGRHRAGRHRWTGPAHRRAVSVTLPGPGVVTATTAVVCALGVVGVSDAWAHGAEPALAADRGASAWARSAPTSRPASALASARVRGRIRPKARRIAGLSRAQTDNARLIVEVGRSMGLPERAYVIAVACAMQ